MDGQFRADRMDHQPQWQLRIEYSALQRCVFRLPDEILRQQAKVYFDFMRLPGVKYADEKILPRFIPLKLFIDDPQVHLQIQTAARFGLDSRSFNSR